MEVKVKDIKLEFINDARVILLGIAALLVFIFHAPNLDYMELIKLPILSHFMNFIQKIGNCGVDIFLFLSGIGLYLSLTKNNVFKFYKNRFIKIMPRFLIVLIIYSFFVVEMKGIRIIENLLGLPFYLEGVLDEWYMSFIMLMYLIFPLIYKIIKKYDMRGLFIMLFFSVVLNFLLSIFFNVYYFKWEIGLTRIPIFLIGAFVGKKIYDGVKISINSIRICVIIMLLTLIILYLNINLVNFSILVRYLYCILAVCFVISISWLYSLLKNKKTWLLVPIKFMGKHSLEIYLISYKCIYILTNTFKLESYVDIYVLSFIITLILSYALNKLVCFVIDFSGSLFKKMKIA